MALKIGLVAGVTGVSIATPILLNRKGANSYVVTSLTDSFQSSSLGEESRTEEGTGLGGRDSEALQRQQEIGTDNSHNQTISTPSQLTSDNFDKTCFEVPATSDSDENMQLLTCFDTSNLERANREDTPEFDNLFHLYNKETKDNPEQIAGKLKWNSETQKISFNLSDDSSPSQYIFTVQRDNWEIKLGNSENLKSECTIFGVTSKDSEGIADYWLACGSDSSDFSPDEPQGIKLTSWKKQ
ncbi:hypothetical protein WEN_02215 [Mycoplasma wenyonii str. Massachusetts]|uniref:Uncharacterized protein n=1 Tax=Mycoplasma wenyonii (strain Massachusetts) TaxID=1197325 RepID=I6ZJ41_MYCWM|nr:hypothetical protein WEN_02215 [Mycoplasma wenyonii str. Massachusetts]